MTITSIETLHPDEEILDFVERNHPDLIAIDAPLSLPPGRTSLEDRNAEHFRPSDRELMKRGIRFFPITLGPMRMLTARGIKLKKILTRRNYPSSRSIPELRRIFSGSRESSMGSENFKEAWSGWGLEA